ncbi:transcription termination factor Rho [Verrucomicrobiales bacterium BCK34]|nr:transcription termination factor Rho [Verrucomicrobiales bacterium BCK34]
MSHDDSTDQPDAPKRASSKEKTAAAATKEKAPGKASRAPRKEKSEVAAEEKSSKPKKKAVKAPVQDDSSEGSQSTPDSAPKGAGKEKSDRAPSRKKRSESTSESSDNHSEENSENRSDNEGRDERRNGRQRSPRNSGGRRGNNRRRRQDGGDGKPRNDEAEGESDNNSSGDENSENRPPQKTRKQRYQERKEKERAREAAALEAAPAIESEGIVEISSKGFGFLRESKRGFQQSPKDVFITPEIVRIHGLRDGLMVKCISKEGLRGPQLIELVSINDASPEEYALLPYFEELTAINPNKKLTLETESTRATTRVIDLVAPIGRGQRGLIVAPPRTGKTTLLHHIAEGIQKNYDEEIHLMVLLVDERPEEVTDFQRSFPGVEIFSSSNDSEAKDHARIALLAIERAKRLVEAGKHVVMLMDSITRLARAFNSQMRGGKGRGTASGGLTVGALEVPRRIFAAARNTREAGSLTIIATALIQTNSKADEAIFQEFKGTGNMELVLDRQIAQNYVYPAVDIHKSGTRREELLLPPHVLEKIYVIRRGLGGYKPVDAMEWLLKCMERYPSNAQMLMDIKTNAMV